MIYPQNFEQKIGFDSIRHLLKEKCLSTLGQERVDEMNFSESFKDINEWLEQVMEFIDDDELVEITPQSIRVRKKLLTESDRRRAGRQSDSE